MLTQSIRAELWAGQLEGARGRGAGALSGYREEKEIIPQGGMQEAARGLSGALEERMRGLGRAGRGRGVRAGATAGLAAV